MHNYSREKTAIRGHRKGEKHENMEKKESREERKAKGTDLNGCSVVRRGN